MHTPIYIHRKKKEEHDCESLINIQIRRYDQCACLEAWIKHASFPGKFLAFSVEGVMCEGRFSGKLELASNLINVTVNFPVKVVLRIKAGALFGSLV